MVQYHYYGEGGQNRFENRQVKFGLNKGRENTMAIIRAAVPNTDPKACKALVRDFKTLLKNPLIEFKSWLHGTMENPKQQLVMIFNWATHDFEDDVNSAIRVLQNDEPWLKKLRAGDVAWEYGPNLELFGGVDSKLLIPKALLSLAVKRGLNIHARIVDIEDPGLLAVIRHYHRAPEDFDVHGKPKVNPAKKAKK